MCVQRHCCGEEAVPDLTTHPDLTVLQLSGLPGQVQGAAPARRQLRVLQTLGV